MSETEPRVGMEFSSADAAWKFWCAYGRRIGFGVRKQYFNRRKDGSISSCRFVCCKEGFRKPDKRSPFVRNPRAETRTRCQARIALSEKNGKFIIHEFVETHNHPFQETFLELLLDEVLEYEVEPIEELWYDEI